MEKHPITINPNLPLEKRVQLLESFLAQLWDCMWWITLPPEERAKYESEGFSRPIEKFYEEE